MLKSQQSIEYAVKSL